jgi:Holliday junction resolvase-like predicted endonuclease
LTIHDDSVLEEIARLRAEVKRLRARLDQRTPHLAMLLRRRGFAIYKKEPADDLLIPSQKFLDAYYLMLHKYSFRLFLRDVIKRRGPFALEQVTRYASPSVTNEYLDYLLSVKLVKKTSKGYVLVKGTITSFGTTLEWYVAEVFRREFGSEAVWGVKFRRPKVGGDYDVIAKFEGALFYVEVKSSPPKQIYDSEIAAFLDRVADLSPAIAVFLMDTELRMKDKIVPMFENALAKRFPGPAPVVRLEREIFQIAGRIFIANAKESVVGNLERVFGEYYRQCAALS